MTQETTNKKAARKSGKSGAIGRLAVIAAGALMYSQSRETGGYVIIDADAVQVKPRSNGRFPNLCNHPSGSRAAKRYWRNRV